MLVLAVSVAAVLLLMTVAYAVDELQDIVLVKTFGRIAAVYQGKEDAGLRFKWPWPIQRLVVYDRRTSVFEDTSSEVPTRDKQNMLVTMYCAWRIGDGEKFHRRIEDRQAAQERLRDLLRNYKKDVVGRYDMADFVNANPEEMKIATIEKEIFDRVQAEARENYGIEVVRVGLKSLALPEQVTTAVIDSMKEERQDKVRRLKSEGEAIATAIVERAKAARAKIRKFAERKAEEIRSEGYFAAAKYYELYGDDYKLSMFLRALESFKIWLKERSVILMDPSMFPMLQWMRTGSPSLSDLHGPDRPLKIPKITGRSATQPAANPTRAGPARGRGSAGKAPPSRGEPAAGGRAPAPAAGRPSAHP
jgi:membrane protease subunit HflC